MDTPPKQPYFDNNNLQYLLYTVKNRALLSAVLTNNSSRQSPEISAERQGTFLLALFAEHPSAEKIFEILVAEVIFEMSTPSNNV